jgi:hypothetical protein
MGTMAQLVRHTCVKWEDMGLILVGNILFFLSLVTKHPWFWLPIFFWKLSEYRNMDNQNAFFKLSDYRNIKHWAGKLVKLSDIRYQAQTIRLSDIGYKKKLLIAQLRWFHGFIVFWFYELHINSQKIIFIPF